MDTLKITIDWHKGLPPTSGRYLVKYNGINYFTTLDYSAKHKLWNCRDTNTSFDHTFAPSDIAIWTDAVFYIDITGGNNG